MAVKEGTIDQGQEQTWTHRIECCAYDYNHFIQVAKSAFRDQVGEVFSCPTCGKLNRITAKGLDRAEGEDNFLKVVPSGKYGFAANCSYLDFKVEPHTGVHGFAIDIPWMSQSKVVGKFVRCPHCRKVNRFGANKMEMVKE